MFIAPKGVGKFWINKQGIHGIALSAIMRLHGGSAALTGWKVSSAFVVFISQKNPPKQFVRLFEFAPAKKVRRIREGRQRKITESA
jgi:hypothetical protein